MRKTINALHRALCVETSALVRVTSGSRQTGIQISNDETHLKSHHLLSDPSNLMFSVNSAICSWTMGLFGSPFPWYFMRKSKASCSRPRKYSHRGLSGRNQTVNTTSVAGTAWMMSGMRHDQSEVSLDVPRVIAAAGMAPPFHPVLYKDVSRPLRKNELDA